jgi:hypothetical protein
MKVVVYVEGPSDSLAMQSLLVNLLQQLLAVGVEVRFIPLGGKDQLMRQIPAKAANTLRGEPETIVVALPDLYPANVVFTHTTFTQLSHVLEAQVKEKVKDERLLKRFKVFCFKHDLEALILAAEGQLTTYLGVRKIKPNWKRPVEDQNHNRPPKRIVEQLFQVRKRIYRDTFDAPLILGAASYRDITAACPQCFKPFVDYLESLLPDES